MPPSCLGHVRQRTVRLNHTRAPTYGNVSIRPIGFSVSLCMRWRFNLKSVLEYWPTLAVAHYRRPNGLPGSPRLGSPREMVTYLVSTPPGGAAAAHYTSVSLFHTTVLIWKAVCIQRYNLCQLEMSTFLTNILNTCF